MTGSNMLQLKERRSPSVSLNCTLFNVVVSQNKLYCLRNIIDRGFFC